MAAPEVSRFPNGLCDATEVGAYKNYAGLRPFRYFTYTDDFIRYTASDWVLTETDAGSTEAITTAAEGVLAITNVSAGATDAASLQWAGGSGAVSPQFVWEATKDFILEARFKVSVAATTGALIGVADTDTTPVASLPTNGIFFNKTSASAALLANIRKAGSSTTIAMGNVADDTFVSCVLYYNSTLGTWQAFLDNVLVGTLSTASISPTVNMAQTIGILNGDTAALVLSVDKMFVAKQR